MGISSFVPDVDYSSYGINLFNQKINREDFFQPEFDNLGKQSLSSLVLNPWKLSTIEGTSNHQLTLVNRVIPYIAPSPTGKYWYLLNRTVKSVDGPSVPIVHFDEMDIPDNKVLETADGPVDIAAFGVVHLPDIQRFQKRLRIKINRQFNHYDPKKQKELYDIRQKEITIRLFINPEYGPTTLRPHYHGICWTDSQEVADALLDPYRGSRRENDRSCWHGLIFESWKMCDPARCDAQFVTNSVALRHIQ